MRITHADHSLDTAASIFACAISGIEKRNNAYVVMIETPVDDALVAAFRESGAGVERVNGHLELSVASVEHLNALVDKARSSGVMLTELAPLRSTLEDVFVDLVRATP